MDMPRSSLATALRQLPPCSAEVRGETLRLGPCGARPAAPLASGLSGVRRVSFLDAPNQGAHFAAFLASDLAPRTRWLTLATTPGTAPGDGQAPGPDLSGLLAALAALTPGALGALEVLVAGDTERTFAGAAVHGRLGDIAPVFAAAPRLRHLELYGTFALSRPVAHDALEVIEIIVPDAAGCRFGPPSRQSIARLLGSRFDRLRLLDLELGCPGAPAPAPYPLPAGLLERRRFPALGSFEMDPLNEDDAARVARWRSGG